MSKNFAVELGLACCLILLLSIVSKLERLECKINQVNKALTEVKGR